MASFRYCGRDFSIDDIDLIREIIISETSITRTEISRRVCSKLGWYKLDGGLKDMSCRVALLRMEKDGLITLPAPTTKNGNGKTQVNHTSRTDPGECIQKPVGQLGDLQIELIKSKADSSLWNEYIDRYHYLKYCPLPGAQLRYFVYANNKIVALLGFGASAWSVLPRDQFIGWTSEQRKKNLHLIVNNARFLILPWIKSKNMASKILSLVAKRLPDDWENKYNYRPVLLETFVEIKRFLGTSYKAANWIYVGITKGRGKLDTYKKAALPIKYILILPINKSFKKLLAE